MPRVIFYPGVFLKWAIPTSFQFVFVFSNKHYNFYNKYKLQNVHPLYGAGFWTHNVQNMSLRTQPLGQSTLPSSK